MAHILPSETFATCDGIIFCLFKWLNTVTNGFALTGMLIAFSVAIFLATTNRFGGTRAYGFGAFVGLIGAIWIATMQLMPWWIASIFILNGCIGFVAMILNER